MLMQLVKKDYLIIKKSILIMMATCIILPLLLIHQVPEYAGIMSYVFSTTYFVFILLQSVSIKESLYSKAATLLCSTPYPRKFIVLSKYIFCGINFILCGVIFKLETLLFPQLGKFNTVTLVFTLLFLAIFIGIYLPLQYKLGFEKTKAFFSIVIVILPFCFSYFLKIKNKIDFSFVYSLNTETLCIISILFSFIAIFLSAYFSVKIYNKIDL